MLLKGSPESKLPLLVREQGTASSPCRKRQGEGCELGLQRAAQGGSCLGLPRPCWQPPGHALTNPRSPHVVIPGALISSPRSHSPGWVSCPLLHHGAAGLGVARCWGLSVFSWVYFIVVPLLVLQGSIKAGSFTF